MSQLTVGRRSALQSAANSWPLLSVIPLMRSGESSGAFVKLLEVAEQVEGVMDGRRICECRVVWVRVFGVVDFPTDAGGVEALGVGGPTEFIVLVVNYGAAVVAIGVDRAGHPIQSVRPSGAEDGAVIGVADGEGFGEGELERDVVAFVVAHAEGAFFAVGVAVGFEPVIHSAVVPRGVLRTPRVAGAGDLLGVGFFRVEVEGKEVAVGAVGVGLIEDGFAVSESHGGGVVETADAGEGAEVVVEGAVLLHQQDDVFDVVNGTFGRVGRNRFGESAADVRREERGGECGSGEFGAIAQ